MDTKIPLVRSAALALLLSTAASAAMAELAELRWTGRWGEGSIVYDYDATDSDATFGQGLYIDNIVRFDVTGWEFPEMRAWRFQGTGGSMFLRSWPSAACPSGFDCVNEDYTVLFQLGAALPGDPAAWQVNLSMPYAYTWDGHIPFLQDAFNLGAYISNTLDDRAYSTLDISGRVTHQFLAAPVPEPETLLLTALGLVAVAAGTRRGARRLR